MKINAGRGRFSYTTEMSSPTKTTFLNSRYMGQMISTAIGVTALLLAFFRATLPRLPRWDALDYMMTAEWIAGKHVAFPSGEPIPGMLDARAPVVPYFISWGFRLFGSKLTVGYAVSAIFFGLGIVAVYLLANTFMSRGFAVLAALFFAFNPIIFDWAGQAYTNVEVASVMALALWAFVKARKNDRYTIPAICLFFVAALTRYSGALLVVPIYAMFNIDRDFSIFTWRKVRWALLSASIVTVTITYSWGRFLLSRYGPLFYPKILNFYLFRPLGINNRFVSPLGPAYYVANSLKILGVDWTAFPVLILFLVGMVWCRHAFTEKERPVVTAVRMWFLVSFFFYSIAGVKDLRYAAEFLAPLSIFAAIGFKLIFERLASLRWAQYAAVAGIALTVACGAYGVFHLPGPTEDDIVTNKEARDISEWIVDNVPREKKVASNIWPYINWYAQRETIPTLQPSDLVKSVDFTNYSKELSEKGISYVTFLSPGHALDEADYLTPVWKSSRGGMIVFKVERPSTPL